MPQPSGPADPDGSADEAEDSSGRSASTEALWAEVHIDPIEIALPGGVGYTLRAYRPATDIEAADDDSEAPGDLDDFDAAFAAVAARRRSGQDETDAEADDLDEFEAEFAEDQGTEDQDAEHAGGQDDEDEDGAEESDDDEDEDERRGTTTRPRASGRMRFRCFSVGAAGCTCSTARRSSSSSSGPASSTT